MHREEDDYSPLPRPSPSRGEGGGTEDVPLRREGQASPTRRARLRILVPALVLVAFGAVGAYLIFGQTKAPSEITYVSLTERTAGYTLLLHVVSPQNMYTPQQVEQQNPTDGEVMYSGTMVMPPGQGSGGGSMAGMNMSNTSYPPGWRHMEVHIYDRTTNGVLRDASPVMTVTNDQTGQRTSVPSVTMQSVVEGASDFHYGNNVDLPSGHTYTASVQVRGDVATFHFRL
jgi:hypothetical protein